MALDSKHPQYTDCIPDWQLMRDAYEGERRIKEKRTVYLPATSGMVADGMESPTQLGYQAYSAYLMRAVFPDLVSDAVEAALGIMHQNPAGIELPAQMEDMLERATAEGEGLQALLRRINEQQLVTGRLGLMADISPRPGESDLPYLALYRAEHILNWDALPPDNVGLPVLNLVVLDESGYERNDSLDWKWVPKYRLLRLNQTVYEQGLAVEATDLGSVDLVTPNYRGKTPSAMPFVFINSKDILPTPDNPPLLGLARSALTIYRGEADYRMNLFMQGQDTLVVIGGMGGDDENTRVGAGARLDLPMGGDAKYIGVTATGLSEQRQALDNDRARAVVKSGELIDTRSAAKESGEALKVRVAAQTATLNQIAISGAFGLQTILRKVAEWIGADPAKVRVEPNLDFVDDEMTGKNLVDLMSAKNLGAPLSLESIHRLMRQRGLTEMEFEDEMDMVDGEGPEPPAVDELGNPIVNKPDDLQ